MTTTEEQDRQWQRFWEPRTVAQEIMMADFYSGRQFVLKYLPRWGKSIEAGCGLGRYVWYLCDLGFDIIGVDNAEPCLASCKGWAMDHGYDPNLVEYADVQNLPYPDNHFSGYVSLGVIEHFREGPQRALAEAYRVLRPGGVAIIETPNKYSFDLLYSRTRTRIRSLARSALVRLGVSTAKGVKNPSEFFQYEYPVSQLAAFVASAGFTVVEKRAIDLKYACYEVFQLYGDTGRGWRKRLQPVVFPLLDSLEDTRLSGFGGLSIVIAFKPGQLLNCFFCGESHVLLSDLDNSPFSVPTCAACSASVKREVLLSYMREANTQFQSRDKRTYAYGHRGWPTHVGQRNCCFCGRPYLPHPWFGHFGFKVAACPRCARRDSVSLELGSLHTEQVWGEYA